MTLGWNLGSFACAIGLGVVASGAASPGAKPLVANSLVASPVAVSPPGHAQPAIAQWKLTPGVVVGDGSNDVILERVRSLQLLRNGKLLIADAGAKSIFVVDSLGKSLPAMGRDGEGPAEYRQPYALATIGDTIAVLDPLNSRIGLFNSKGEWQGSWRSQPITGGSDVRLFRADGTQFYNYGYRPEGNTGRTVYVRFDRSGPRDTLVPEKLPPSTTAITCMLPKRISGFSSIFQARHIRIPGPDGTVLDAESDSYRIIMHKSGGPPITTFIGTATRAPLSDAEWDSTTAGFRQFVKENGSSTCDHSSMERPSAKPAIRAFWWDDAGQLWVERYVTKGFAFDVFSKTGVLIATMPAPQRNVEVEPSVVGNRIALLTTSDDAAPVVRVYRVVTGR